MNSKLPIFAIIFFLAMSLSGCLPALFGIAATGTVVSQQDKSFGTLVDDKTIWAKINKEYLKYGIGKIYSNVKVSVSEGRVLLTGSLTKKDLILKAVAIAWSCNGVNEVIHEIKYEDKKKRALQKVSDYIIDSAITGQIKTKMALAGGIKFINYTIITMDKNVYIFGIAKNEHELQRVAQIAAKVKGVQRVSCHARVKGEEVATEAIIEDIEAE